MPYYCTVPRCTSMAGKVKNVSFHQFPRDEELARLWNKILKRGKPYTKYSKVCSLHFTPDDYTITNAGKYKGQWRTLRKDAIPSRNLPIEPPVPYNGRDSASWSPVTNTVDPRLHQQMAQAIYVQTMLAMQAAGVTDVGPSIFSNDQQMSSPNTDRSRSPISNPSDLSFNFDQIEKILDQPKDIHSNEHTDSTNAEISDGNDKNRQTNQNVVSNRNTNFANTNKMTYRCNECSKCFKDPDVYVLHTRIHNRNVSRSSVEKENLDARNNTVDNSQETLKANPILANLLNSGIPQGSLLAQSDMEVGKTFDRNVVSIESHVMTALAANMENYLRNLSSIMTSSNFIESKIVTESVESDNNKDKNPEDDVDENVIGPNFDDDLDEKNDNCDKKDLDDSQDSVRLVIDEDKC